MKYVKFCSIVTFMSLAFFATHFAVAMPMPMTMEPATLYLYQATAVVPAEDDDREEPDDGSDQCRLLFPACEANVN